MLCVHIAYEKYRLHSNIALKKVQLLTIFVRQLDWLTCSRLNCVAAQQTI